MLAITSRLMLAIVSAVLAYLLIGLPIVRMYQIVAERLPASLP